MGLFGNYSKPGKGIRKDEAQKKRFFLFFEIFGRKFTKLIQLNLIYFLFCIPIVTFGPATTALIKITKSFSEEKPVFLFSDFYDAFKSNFKQSFFIGLINILMIVVGIISFNFYLTNSVNQSLLFGIPLFIVGTALVVFLFMCFYIYLLISCVNLNLSKIIKNAFVFAFLGVKTNILTMLFTGLILIPSILYLPYTFPLFLLIIYSTIALIISFNSFQYIYKYTIKPYYELTGEKDPYAVEESEEEEMIFTDTTT